jgi:glyoxylase I family protein
VPEFAGLNHVSLSVTDLDASQRFYTEVLGFLAVLDTGTARVCLHKQTGFALALVRHRDGAGGRFDETRTGIDHLGFAAADRDELVAWQQRLEAAGVEHSPIQDLPLGHHLNFRDPDGIALELQAPTAEYAAALTLMRDARLSDADVLAAAAEMIGADLVARPLD